jgi:glyoxylase-like metal-dependent hydrolase (beta-lactamase superfamily II)
MRRQPDGVLEVADGVRMITRAHTNCYIVETVGGPILVDAGLPRAWSLLAEALAASGHRPDDLRGVYLTHGHFDHVGMADRLFREHHTPLHVHDADVTLARHPYRYLHESPRLRYPLQYPAMIPGITRMTWAGALGVRGVSARGDVRPGRQLPGVPELEVVASPGHTDGHCAFLLRERGILFSGDDLVTYDPYTGAAGPRVVARAATADSARALQTLDALARTEARLVLPGHGAPWWGDVGTAVAQARAVGVA